jgi:hypothetical protein
LYSTKVVSSNFTIPSIYERFKPEYFCDVGFTLGDVSAVLRLKKPLKKIHFLYFRFETFILALKRGFTYRENTEIR